MSFYARTVIASVVVVVGVALAMWNSGLPADEQMWPVLVTGFIAVALCVEGVFASDRD